MKELTIEETQQVSGGDMDCYLDSFGAVIATGGAIAFPNPWTAATAAWSWAEAYDTCLQ